MEHLNLVACENYERMSGQCADRMLDLIRQKPNALICLASGGSTKLAYDIFVRKVKEKSIDATKIQILKLDEWWGLPDEHPASCELYLQETVIKPLGLRDDQYIGFCGTANDAQKECMRITAEIQARGGIDLCILGYGVNGHIGFNEPGKDFFPYAAQVILSEESKTHAMVAEMPEQPEYGITLGAAGHWLRFRISLRTFSLTTEWKAG